VLALSTARLDFSGERTATSQLQRLPLSSETAANAGESRSQTGATVDKKFTIRNDGTGALIGGMTLIATGSGGNVFRLQGDPTLKLSPGQSFEVMVSYHPVDNSPAEGSVRISTNAGVKSIFLRGNGIGVVPQAQAQLTVSPSSINFRSVEVAKFHDDRFTVINTGKSTLTGEVSLAAPFSLVSGGTFSVEPGKTHTVVVRFAPTTSGSVSQRATITSNGGSATVQLLGIGEQSQLCVDPASLNFGTITEKTTKDLTLTVENCGNGSLSGNVEVAAPFSVVTGANFALAEGGSQTVTIRFAPLTDGEVKSSAKITTASNSTTVSLVGAVLKAEPVKLPKLCFEPTALSFGGVPVGSTADLFLVLTNCGTADLTLSLALTGPFTLVTQGPASLAVGEKASVAIRFAPRQEGSQTGTLTLTFNNQQISISLAGEGKGVPKVCTSHAALEFGAVSPGVDKDLSFTITNCGDSVLTGNVTTTAPFSIVTGGQFSLTKGNSQVVIVRFMPTKDGTFVDIAAVNSDGGTASVKLMGSSVKDPKLCVSPAVLDFTVSSSATTGSRPFSIENCGGGVLTGTATLSCKNCDMYSQFSFASFPGIFTLKAGEKLLVTVNFSTYGDGSLSDTIDVVASNGDAAVVQLQGSGGFFSNLE